MFKTPVIALSLWAALGLTPAAAQAAVDVDLVVRIPPPVVRVEARPAPRMGYLWVPGYWGWRDTHHVWVAGTWVRERPGYVYERPAWVERDGQWHLAGGRWSRHDKDRDGVPNGRDPDRDGDGVPNWADRHPNGGQ